MDKFVFNSLMTDIRPKLYRFALSLTKRVDEAEDIVQDVGIKLWEQRDKLVALHSIEAYAMRAVRNRCIDGMRSPCNRIDELSDTYDLAHEQTPHKILEQSDMVALVRTLVDKLPEQQQMVMRLRDIEGYELAEIAEILGMNEGAVRTNLSRGRQKVRDELIKQY